MALNHDLLLEIPKKVENLGVQENHEGAMIVCDCL